MASATTRRRRRFQRITVWVARYNRAGVVSGCANLGGSRETCELWCHYCYRADDLKLLGPIMVCHECRTYGPHKVA